MRIFKFFMLITVLSFSFSQTNVSAEEGDFESLHKKYPNAVDTLTEDVSGEEGDFESLHKKYPNAVDTLTEDSKEEAKKLEQKVSEDMRNNPDKVEYAVPLDDSLVSTQAVYLPYAYDFNYQSSLRGANFISVSGYTTLNNQITVNSPTAVTFTLYTKSGTYVGSRIYPAATTSTASFKIQPGQEYYFVLTGGSGWKYGSGYTWVTLY